MGEEIKHVQQKVAAFRRKYYLNTFLKGSMLSFTILLGYFLLASLLEYTLWLDSSFRFLLLTVFVAVAAYCLWRFLRTPLQFWLANKGINDEQSARLIGQQLPQVRDQLVNFFQLSAQSQTNELRYASVKQKATVFESISFEEIVKLGENKRYLRYLVIPVGVALLIALFNSSMLTQPSGRILRFNHKFSPQAPFDFFVNPDNLTAFANEDFTLIVRLSGTALPEDVYILRGDQRMKMSTADDGTFRYHFDRLSTDLKIQVEAAGFYSDIFTIPVVVRPDLLSFEMELTFPRYLSRSREVLKNAGNLEVPEGTSIRWNISTEGAKRATIAFGTGQSPSPLEETNEHGFTFEKNFRNPDEYELTLSNEFGTNKDRILYRIDVVKDKHPEIGVRHFNDSLLYQYVAFSGEVRDDYAVRKLNLVVLNGNKAPREIPISIVANQLQQNFFYQWQLDTLNLAAGDKLEYYFEVWDNDGVNGSKSTRTATYTFSVPTKDELETAIRQSEKATQQKISQSQTRAAELQKQLEQATQQLKATQNLNWQDKKRLEDIVQQKNELDKLLNEVKKESEQLQDKKEAFTEESERIREKSEQIQKLMNELLDEETRKLFEELEKLLKENADAKQMQQLLEKMEQNSGNLEKELDRALELFKQLQLESKVEQATEQLKETIKHQEQLLKETERAEKDSKSRDNGGSKTSEELAKDQQAVSEEFKDLEQKLDEIKKLDEEIAGSDLETPSDEQQQGVEQQQQQSKESLEQGEPSKSKGAQQKAVEQMKQMQDKMEKMQSSMGMEMDMENLESLRQILHGLIKLSYDQEGLIAAFRELNQSDPRFNTLAQQQIKVQEDANILEDSLLALGKRDPMMGSFITREVTELQSHLEKTIDANKERRRSQAQTEMQFSMTSMNNLALMLDDHFDMMMQMMANAKPGMGKSKKKGKPQSLSQMQQQLNQRIQDLKNSGKGGKELSEELAKSAAEQERIRKALKEFQDKMKEQGKEMPGGDLLNKMEQSEMDLVNKQLTEQLIRRQKEIESRLLEAEKSMREQEEDEERKGETAKDHEKEIPREFEEYLRLKEKEVELLKTVPPKLFPYYKQEVNEYFKRLRDQ